MTLPASDDRQLPAIVVRLLGGFEVALGGRPIPREAFARRKAISLLKLLALQPAVQLHREQILELLWPDLSPESGSRQLYKSIYHVRQAFASRGLPLAGDQLLRLESDVVSLDAPGGVATDVGLFEQLARAALQNNEAGDLRQAIHAYAGDLLPDDRFEPWAETRRWELHEQFVDLLVELGRALLQAGQLAEAADALRQALTRDEPREDAHRTLMQVYARQGSRGRAVRQYQRCVEILRRELGVPVSADTEALYQAILTGALAAGSPPLDRHLIDMADVPPLVGRERELQLIGELGDQLAQGTGAVLAIEGEPGIGKTRLTQEIARLGRRHHWQVFSGAVQEQEGQIPYRPFVAALRQALWSSPAGAELIPAELAVSIPELPAAAASIHTADKLAAQSALFAGVLRFLTARAARAPVVLILDDLHAADTGSLKLFHYLARQTANLPLLIVSVARTTTTQPAAALRNILNSLSRQHALHRIQLEPLTETEQGALLAQTLGEGQIAPELAAEIARLAEGNALFTYELVQQLVADGRVSRQDDLWQLRLEPGADNRLAVPPSLQLLIAQRTESLSEPARRLIQLAAVIGREIPLRLLERGLGASQIGSSLLDSLDEVLHGGLLIESGLHYRFTHALLREAIYQQLSSARARVLHRTVAEEIEALYRDQPSARPLDELAYQFRRAGETARAVRYLIEAGAQASAVYDHDGALERYTEALGLLDEPGSAGETAQHRAGLLERIADARRAIGEVERSHEAYVQALDARATPPDDQPDPRAFRLYLKLAHGAILTGDLPAAAGYLGQAQAARPADPLNHARYLITQALFDWHANQPEAAIEHATQALTLAEQIENHETESQACEMLALAHLTSGNWAEGTAYELRRRSEDWSPEIVVAIDAHLCLYEYRLHGIESYQQMQRFLETVAEQTAAIGNLRCLAVCHYALGTLAFVQGLPDAASENLARAFELHQRIGSPAGLAYTLAAQADLHTALGTVADGWRLIERGTEIAREAAIRDHCLMRIHTAGIWNRLAAGDRAGLDGIVRAAQAHDAVAGPCTVCRVHLYEALATVRLSRGELDSALDYTEQALQVAAYSQNQPGRARALRARAQILAARGEPAEQLLSEAIEIFQSLGDLYDLARTLLVWDDLVDEQHDDPNRAEQLRTAIETLARFTPRAAASSAR